MYKCRELNRTAPGATPVWQHPVSSKRAVDVTSTAPGVLPWVLRYIVVRLLVRVKPDEWCQL